MRIEWSALVWACATMAVVGCDGHTDVPAADSVFELSSVASSAPRRCWSIVSLGSLGGGAVATRINRRGEVIGFSTTATGEGGAFYWSGGALQQLTAFGSSIVQADDINDRGDIVGFARDSAGRMLAVEWIHGEAIELPTLGGPNGEAHRINNRGQIVGWTTRPDDVNRRYAVLWDRGRVEEIGSPTVDVFPDGLYLNGRGQVAGTFAPTNGSAHPFFWERGRFVDLGTLGGTFANATGLNEWGEVIGRSDNPTPEPHGFLWRGGRLEDLGSLGGGFASPTAINDLGFVAGDSATADGLDHGFLWWNGWRRDITPDVHGYVRVAAINNRNEIAGNYIALQSFVWSGGRLTKLPDLGGPVEVYDINDEGVIVGRARDAVRSNAALWVPGRCAASP